MNNFITVVLWPLNCLQVIELETKDLTQNVLNDDQCNKIVEHTTKSWEIFSKYQPEFKVVSRVSNFNNI